MADKVKEVARQEAESIKTETIKAARSAAYLYPLRVGLHHEAPIKGVNSSTGNVADL